jgi:hypothetical protein
MDFSEKRSLPITIPDYKHIQVSSCFLKIVFEDAQSTSYLKHITFLYAFLYSLIMLYLESILFCESRFCFWFFLFPCVSSSLSSFWCDALIFLLVYPQRHLPVARLSEILV